MCDDFFPVTPMPWEHILNARFKHSICDGLLTIISPYCGFVLSRCADASPDQPALLKVGSWVYPLVPGQSPVLKSHIGKYMFPDLDDSIEGKENLHFSCLFSSSIEIILKYYNLSA